MAKTTDELFAEATEADYETIAPVVLAASDTEEEFQFRIDEHLRTIAIPEKGVVAGVEGDLNVNIARFTMVRYYHGRDLSKLSIRINYRNANGQVNYYNVSDAVVSGDSIVFSWEYAADVTQYKGNVQFVVYLFSATNAVLKQRFFTTLGTLEVLEGLEVDSSIPVSEQTDILLHLKKDLSAYAEEVKKSLPADYTAMTEQVNSLKEELENLKKIVEALQESMGQIYGNIVVSETTISMDEGTSVTFTVSLDKAPSENQTVEITTKGSYVTISPSTLTFTPDNYNVAQRVTVSSIDDEDEGDKQETITLASVYKTVQISITIVNNDVSIEWHTVTMDDIKVATVVGVNCITAITTTEPYLNFPADLPCLRLSTACETVKGIKLNDGGKAEWDSAEYNLLDRYPNLETVTGGGINLHDRTGAKRTTMPFNFGGVAENIKEFTFYPIGLTSISQTFKGMTKLEKIFDIPETVTSWAFAFNNCVSLHKVTVKSDTLSLNDSLPAFTGVPACTIKCNNASTIHSEIVAKTGMPQITSKNVPYVQYFESLDEVSPKNINCFGDSLTHGINNINPYTYHLKNMLSADEYLVYNVSQVGYTSSQIKESFMDVCKPCVKDITVIWSGSNDEDKTATVEQLVSNVQSLVDTLPTGVDYIVVGLITYQWSKEVDTAFENAFGTHFLNMHDYFLSESAFTNIGAIPTDVDTTAMASGTLPSSLIANQHQTELGSQSTAFAIKEKLLSMGY